MQQNAPNTVIEKVLAFEKETRDFGFTWSNEEMIIDQAISECLEIKNVIKHKESKKRLQEEIGDLIAAAFALCYFTECDIIETIENNIQKLNARMYSMKKITANRGLANLKNQSHETKLEIWDEAKQHEQL